VEKRPYFLIGDLLTNSLTGAVVALACTSLFSEAWPHVLAMVAGMFVGSAVGMLLATLASVALGAFEVMLPVMTTGMLVGMLSATSAAELTEAAAGGALVGVGVLVLTYLLNARIHRQGGTWTP
jgi:hypothetical protein